MDMDTIAGLLQTVPAHAIVIIFALCSELSQLTMTAGMGYNIFPGFHSSFSIIPSLLVFLKNNNNTPFSISGDAQNLEEQGVCAGGQTSQLLPV
jgi:hypothetical protein